MSGSAARSSSSPARACGRFVLGFAAVQGLFEVLARQLQSDRGQAGAIVCLAVVSALVFVERWMSGRNLRDALRALGLRRPAAEGLKAAALGSAVLLLMLSAVVSGCGSAWAIAADWPQAVPGIVLQAGVAEEALFRGYVYRRLRDGRSFREATRIALIPFALVHLPLFLTLPWPVALLAVALAAAISTPLAGLFELGGRSLWPPALLHGVVQGALKVVVIEDAPVLLPLLWMAAAALVSRSLLRRAPLGAPRPGVRHARP